VLAADRRAWRTALNNLGANGAKLITAVCVAAGTAYLFRGLTLSATEATRTVALEQVETTTRAAPRQEQ